MSGQASDAGNQAPHLARISNVPVAMDAREVWLLDAAHLQLERDDQRDEAGRGKQVRDHERQASCGDDIAVKIGLRAIAEAPSVTRTVRSVSSTPMRHDSPIDSCAARVNATPTTATATPTPFTTSLATSGAEPASAATGAAMPTTSATVKRTPAEHSKLNGLPDKPRQPESPGPAQRHEGAQAEGEHEPDDVKNESTNGHQEALAKGRKGWCGHRSSGPGRCGTPRTADVYPIIGTVRFQAWTRAP